MSKQGPTMVSARRGRAGRLLLLVSVVSVLLVLLVNLSWFDEPLSPRIEALRQARPAPPLEGNGYPFALGFLAADSQDPRVAGVEIIARLRELRDRGEPMTLGKEQKQAILGTPPPDPRVKTALGFHCQARHHVDCAQRLVAWMGSVDLNAPRLAVLFERYEMLLQQPHFVETPEPDLETPWPPLDAIVALGRLRLARSLRADTTPVFLEKVSQELAFWRMALREGDRLGMKMVALAAIRNAHDVVAAAVRERNLDHHDLELFRRVIRPLTHDETDIGAGFVSEARGPLLSGVTPAAQDSSWPTRLVLQENATFNQFFREKIEPMRLRSSLAAREYFEKKGYEPLRHELRFTPGVFYNLGGKWALSRSLWDPEQFPARVHDEDGRIALLLLQAQIEEHPESDVEALVRDSEYRNPYTGAPMEYDAQARTIEFACLHTAFHPPEPGDQCAVALSPAAPPASAAHGHRTSYRSLVLQSHL
jgi:hypothetical protein